MKKLALALIWTLSMTSPVAALFLWATVQSLMPSTIGWNAKNAWVKCDGAITGTLEWPSPLQRAAPRCTCAPTRQHSVRISGPR